MLRGDILTIRCRGAAPQVESDIKTDPNALVVWSGSLTSIERKTVKQMVGGAPISMISSLAAKELCPSIGPMNATVKNSRWYYEVRSAHSPPRRGCNARARRARV